MSEFGTNPEIETTLAYADRFPQLEVVHLVLRQLREVDDYLFINMITRREPNLCPPRFRRFPKPINMNSSRHK